MQDCALVMKQKARTVSYLWIFFIYFCIGLGKGKFPIIYGEAPPCDHAHVKGLRVFSDRWDWEGKPRLTKVSEKNKFLTVTGKAKASQATGDVRTC
jgi:hypothetical protein